MDFAGRSNRLRELLEKRGLSGLIVTHLPNVRYLTNFSGSAATLLVLPDDLVLFTDFRYENQAATEVGSLARVEIVTRDTWGRVWEAVDGAGLGGRAGFEAHATTVADSARFEQFETGAPLPATELVETLRASKEPEEVAAIRAAAQVAVDALGALLDGSLRVGMRELDVAAELERELRVRGSEWHPFETIVASGPRTALPHAGTTEKVICTGDLVLIDFGARVDGYCSDITRTVVMGPATERQRDVYGIVERAQHSACRGVREGMEGREADGLARAIIEDAGYGPNFGHSTGHGLGLEVHEAPRLSAASSEPLPRGSVVTVEPGIYLDGWGGVRIEDDVYLGDAKSDILSHFTTELIQID